MDYEKVKKQQEKALADFAYYTGILTHASGCANEHLAPTVQFQNSGDYERLSPIWNAMTQEGYNQDKYSKPY